MSTQDAVAALTRLGLSNYEAKVFVALQRLGTGTTQEISDISEVPRSQVYGAADDLAERGLVEVVTASPKEYRPVSLEAARQQLTDRIERERDRAFENLESLRATSPDSGGNRAVATVRGSRAIDDRIAELIATASSEVVFVAPEPASLTDDIEAALRERGAAGVAATVVTAVESERERFADSPVVVMVMGEDNPADFAGRALMVDEGTVLLSVATDDAVGEEAMWTAESSIGRILAEFMVSGIDSGMNRDGGPSPPDSS
ncbi:MULTISPECIES: TrmB family transcriptional regulator [Halobacterium]|uniref:TrmB family transcriptional regulator n=1 Tax=Halobacterium TaxID=2239 RepID=UPI00073F7DD9|nr:MULTISPECIES: helix-turn-helix domain-containing protein [Halobacterium]MCG1002130.1 TrmB family transcriptional regulator [Halobacterium noricense]